MRLHLVTAEADGDTRKDEDLNHGTGVLLDLVEPWRVSNRRVCADSFFASVEAAEKLLQIGLKFIAVVKNATQWAT